MSRNGFVKLRRGAVEHLESGHVGLIDLGIFALLLLRANSVVGNGSLWPAGIVMTSAKAISAYAPRNIGDREIQRSLSNLERAGWIKRFRTPGRHGNYPVLLCRHSVHDLSGNEFRVDAENTSDWRHPKLVPVSELSSLAERDGTRAGTELSPSREEKTKNRENNKGAPVEAARSTAQVSSSNENLRVLTDKLVAAYEAQRGYKPTWTTKDYKQLDNLRKRATDKEILRRFNTFIRSDTRYLREKGWSLSLCCTDFDAYAKDPILWNGGGNHEKKRGHMPNALKQLPPKRGTRI